MGDENNSGETKAKFTVDGDTKSAQDGINNLGSKVDELIIKFTKLGKQIDLDLDKVEKLSKLNTNVKLNISTSEGNLFLRKGASKESEASIDKIASAIARQKNSDSANNTRRSNTRQYEAETERAALAERKLEEERRKETAAADAEYKSSRTRYYNAKSQNLYGYNQYSPSFSGGVAAALFNQGERYSYRNGFTGMAARLGSKWGNDSESWFGKRFGKLSKEKVFDANGESTSFTRTKDIKGNINTLFGGLLKSGTKSYLGINAGGLVLGASAMVLEKTIKAVGDFGIACLDAYGNIEKLNTSLEVVYGSKVQSNQAFNNIQQYAVKSPYGVSQTTDLAILLKQSGVYSTDLLKTLEMIGDVSSGNEEKMKRIANNYAQIQAIGHASMLDMRQFAYAGIPIYKEVADYMNVSQSKLREMIKDGKVTSDVIEKVFQKMTGEGGLFNGAVEKGSRTYSARKQNLEDIKNIEKANFGDYLYNISNKSGKGGIGNGIMYIKEDWHKEFSDMYKSWNIDKESEISGKSQKIIENIGKNINTALSSGDKQLAEILIKYLNNYKNSVRNEDEIRAGLANKGNHYLEREGVTYGQQTYSQQSIDEAKSIAESYIKEHTDNSGKLDSSYSKDIYESLKSIANSMVSESSYERAWNNLPHNIKQAIIESKIQEWQTANFESYQKYQNSPNSIASLTEKYNQLYAQSKQGKAEQLIKDKNDLAKYRSDYAKYSKMINKDGSLKYGQFSREELISVIKSGILEAEDQISLKPEDLKVNEYDTPDTKLKKMSDWKMMHDKAASLNASIMDGTFNKNFPDLFKGNKFNNPYGNLLKRLSSITNVSDSSQINKNINSLIQIVSELSTVGEKTGTSSILGKIFTRDGISDMSKFTEDMFSSGSGGGRSVPELWKRIFGAATGIDAYHIGSSSGYSAMMSYNNFQNRNIVGGAIKGLSASGLNSSQIASLLQFTGGTTNGDNVVITQKNGKALSNKNLVTVNGTQTKQIDWERSMKSVVEYALSGKGNTNTLANELNSLDDTMKSQLSVYTNLINTMQVTQEDWANIDTKSLSASENKALENAFAGGNNGAYATDKNGEVFDVKYDAESRQWITTEGNKIVNAANGLTLKSDSITEALDMMQLKTQNLAVQISVANSLAQTSNELRKSSQENNIKSFMSSGYLQSNLGLTSEYSYNNKSNSYNKEAYDKVSSLLTERLISLANETSSIQNNEEELDKWNNKRYSKDASGKYIEDAKGTFARDAIGNYVDANSKYEKLNTEKIKLLIQFVEAINNFNVSSRNSILNEIMKGDTSVKVKDEADNYSRSLENNAYASSIGDYVSNYQQYNGNGGLLRALNNGMYVQNGNTLNQQQIMERIGFSNGNFDRWSSGIFAQNYGKDNNYTNSLNSYMSDRGYKGNIAEQIGYEQKAQQAFDAGDLEKGNDILSKMDKNAKKLIDDFNKSGVAASDMASQLEDLGKNLGNVFRDFASNGITSTFETLGKSLASSSDASDDLAKNFQQIGQSLFSQMGQMLVSAGLQMIISSAGDKSEIFGGLALIAAGGMSSLLSGMMSTSNDSKDDSEYEKLKKIKEDLSSLLKQARDDAVYYEHNLQHQTALSINSSVSSTKVNDAVITPSGNVISTHPDDYLIATKSPNALLGSGSSPNVNFTIQNNGQSVQLESQSVSKDGNDIDITAVIKNVAGQYIASHESDTAFAARQFISSGNRFAR